MTNDQPNPDRNAQEFNRDDQMSDDLDAGGRGSETLGRDGGATAAETPAEQDLPEESTIEAFDQEGAGIASKE